MPRLPPTLALRAGAWRLNCGGGKPDGDPRGGGNPPVWSLSVPPTDSRIIIEYEVIDLVEEIYQSNVILELDSPVKLNSGTYWLVFYPLMDFNTFGQYGRFTADTTNRSSAQVINPDQGWPQDPADPARSSRQPGLMPPRCCLNSLSMTLPSACRGKRVFTGRCFCRQ